MTSTNTAIPSPEDICYLWLRSENDITIRCGRPVLECLLT